MARSSFLGLVALTAAAQVAVATSSGTSYTLEDTFDSSNFFDSFTWFTDADPTAGFVSYQDQSSATSAGLATISNNQVRLGVDSTSTVDSSTLSAYVGGDTSVGGRKSVRLQSKKTYTKMLMVADIEHMPVGCGTWPALWTWGTGSWPADGEIDIIEGANSQTTNEMTLHTSEGCSPTNSGQDAGTSWYDRSTGDCAAGSGNTGCPQRGTSTSNFGTGFNSAQGGVYAMEWTDAAISIWFWPRGSVPGGLGGSASTVDTGSLGTPLARFEGGSGCDISSHFQGHVITVNTALCGQWAGQAWAADGTCGSKADSCAAWVAGNPDAFADAYWLFNSIKVYTAGPGSANASSTAASKKRDPADSRIGTAVVGGGGGEEAPEGGFQAAVGEKDDAQEPDAVLANRSLLSKVVELGSKYLNKAAGTAEKDASSAAAGKTKGKTGTTAAAATTTTTTGETDETKSGTLSKVGAAADIVGTVGLAAGAAGSMGMSGADDSDGDGSTEISTGLTAAPTAAAARVKRITNLRPDGPQLAGLALTTGVGQKRGLSEVFDGVRNAWDDAKDDVKDAWDAAKDAVEGSPANENEDETVPTTSAAGPLETPASAGQPPAAATGGEVPAESGGGVHDLTAATGDPESEEQDSPPTASGLSTSNATSGDVVVPTATGSTAASPVGEDSASETGSSRLACGTAPPLNATVGTSSRNGTAAVARANTCGGRSSPPLSAVRKRYSSRRPATRAAGAAGAAPAAPAEADRGAWNAVRSGSMGGDEKAHARRTDYLRAEDGEGVVYERRSGSEKMARVFVA